MIVVNKLNLWTLDAVEEFCVECDKLGYKNIQLFKLWYQQYGYKQTHGWHTHARNYTGTYYLQLPDDAPNTEFLYADNLDKGFSINQNGDVIDDEGNIVTGFKALQFKEASTVQNYQKYQYQQENH